MVDWIRRSIPSSGRSVFGFFLWLIQILLRVVVPVSSGGCVTAGF
jgi:hypothetical protein